VEFHTYKVRPIGGGKSQGGMEFFNEGGGKIQPNNKEDNKDINISSSIKGRFDFLKSLVALGVQEQTARDWMQVRKAKKASNTETAFRKIEQEIAKSGATAEDCIRMSAECSWAGFKAEWMHNRQQKAGTPAPLLQDMHI
jgi:Fic family protein